MKKVFKKTESNKFKSLLENLAEKQIKNITISLDGGLTLGESNEFIQLLFGDFEINLEFKENAPSENITVSW
jgi:hypothetical protein